MEIWKQISGYEGIYDVSNLGRVKSLERIVKRGDNTSKIIKPRILKSAKTKNGYLFVTLCSNGVSKMFSLHRLVAFYFVEGYKEGLEVNHFNENKEDNRAENLSWVTHKENINHGTAIERRVKNSNFKGENNPMYGRVGRLAAMSKSVSQLTIDGKLIKRFSSITEAANELGFKVRTIYASKKRKGNISLGYAWKF